MPIEQRVVSAPKIGAGKIGAKQAAAPEPAAEPKKKRGKGGKKKLLVIGAAALVVVVAAAAAYFFVLAPQGSSAGKAAPPQPTTPASIVDLDAHSLNLADGHYLRLGISLELTKKNDTLDGAPALDAAIAIFSGRTVDEVTDPATREQLRAELLAKCQEAYGKDLVMGVKFSDYVTQ